MKQSTREKIEALKNKVTQFRKLKDSFCTAIYPSDVANELDSVLEVIKELLSQETYIGYMWRIDWVMTKYEPSTQMGSFVFALPDGRKIDGHIDGRIDPCVDEKFRAAPYIAKYNQILTCEKRNGTLWAVDIEFDEREKKEDKKMCEKNVVWIVGPSPTTSVTGTFDSEEKAEKRARELATENVGYNYHVYKVTDVSVSTCQNVVTQKL